MNDRSPVRIVFWIVCIFFLALLIRFGWLVQSGGLIFDSDVSSLLPPSQESKLIDEIEFRVSAKIDHRIAIAIQGGNGVEVDIATDLFLELIDEGIVQGHIEAEYMDGLELTLLSDRINAMAPHKNKFISDRTRDRMRDSFDAQLKWRSQQVAQFPPSNLTDPVADPLGTIEEFLAERMPRNSTVQFDGIYFRVDSDFPTNLVLIRLTSDSTSRRSSIDSVDAIQDAKSTVTNEYSVELHLSGIPLHAAIIERRTVDEIRWMSVFATLLTLSMFLVFTRSIRALIITTVSVGLAIVGGLVISQWTIGLPHLIGLTMAITAIGICIDFSFHFWTHVRAGMSGKAAIQAIFSSINVSFLTTVMGLLGIVIVSIPLLSRSAVFICGALLVSWLAIVFVAPGLCRKMNSGIPVPRFPGLLRFKYAYILPGVILGASMIGLLANYTVDDSPSRLAQPASFQVAEDIKLQELLGSPGRSEIYLVQAESADGLLELEDTLLESMSNIELAEVVAVSRLVPSIQRQLLNKDLYNQARTNIDQLSLTQYLARLQVSKLDWESSEREKPLSLQWVLSQPWADLERDLILSCDDSFCSSIIRAQGAASDKLQILCENNSACEHISLAGRKKEAFKNLRKSLIWALLVAVGIMFAALFVRYRVLAVRLISIPVIASLAGVATVASAGMPITAFTLAAIFPLLGLSIDYAVFACESDEYSGATLLAILGSALTTTLSFAILSFSGTPAVQFFALPIAIGIPVAWVLVQTLPRSGVWK